MASFARSWLQPCSASPPSSIWPVSLARLDEGGGGGRSNKGAIEVEISPGMRVYWSGARQAALPVSEQFAGCNEQYEQNGG